MDTKHEFKRVWFITGAITRLRCADRPSDRSALFRFLPAGAASERSTGGGAAPGAQ